LTCRRVSSARINHSKLEKEKELNQISSYAINDDAKAPLLQRGEEEEKKDIDEKLKEKLKRLEEKKKKSMNAWGDTGVKKSFGLWGYSKFTWPRIWTGSFRKKFIVLLNIFMLVAWKLMTVFVPIVLKLAVDAITCSKGIGECPSVQETYLFIGLYALCKFLADTLNYIREIPYAAMAAQAEISIAHDVYDHV